MTFNRQYPSAKTHAMLPAAQKDGYTELRQHPRPRSTSLPDGAGDRM